MQASKYIFIRLIPLAAIIAAAAVSGCGKKTPDEIAAENRKATELSIRRARVLMFEEKSADAIKLLEDTYQKRGTSAELCEALAYAYIQNGQTASAAMFFESAAAQKDGDPELQISAAKAYEQSNADASAANAYEKYLKLKPSDTVAWKSYSACLERLEKYSDALNAMMGALKSTGRNPNTSEATKIGLLFVKTGNPVQARNWLEAAYKATLPTNVETRKEILLGLATVYLAQKETALLNETVAELDKIAPGEIDKKYPKLREQLAAFKENLEAAQRAMKAKEEQAQKPEQKAEEKAPEKKEEKPEEKSADDKTDQPALEAEKTEDAEAPIAPSQTVDAPANAQANASAESAPEAPALSEYDELVKKCYEAVSAGDAPAAEKAAHLAISKDPAPEAAWRALAKAYEISGKSADSYMAAEEAYKRNPDNIDSTLFYLRNASRVLNNEKFLNKVYRAYEKFPNNPEIWVDLARTYKLIGDKRNAAFFYDKFLTQTPSEHPLYDEMKKEQSELSAEK